MNPYFREAIGEIIRVKKIFYEGTCKEWESYVDAKILTQLLWIYASAVVGRTLTYRVLVSRDFTEESDGSSWLRSWSR